MTTRAWLPLLLLLSSTNAQNASTLDRDYWLRLALRTQNYLTRSNSVATNLYCGTYQSANSLHYSSLRTEATFGVADGTGTSTRHYCPSESEPEKCFTATGTFRLFDQMKSIEEQLEMGVRRFHFQLVRIGILSPPMRVCKPIPQVCQTLKRELSSLGLYDYASNVDICHEILGMNDYGDEFTGCSEDSPTWSDVLEKFGDFLKRSGNSREIVIIEVDTSVMQQRYGCTADALVEDPVRDILGDLIYSPADLNNFVKTQPTPAFFDPSNTPIEWPTATQVFSRERQIVLMAPCKYSGRWFHQSTDFYKFQELSSAKEFVPNRCGTRKGAGGFIAALSKQFTGIYEDRTTFEINIQADDGSTQRFVYLTDGVETAGTMDEQAVERVVNCGFSPMFSRMQENRIFDCVWFWGEGESSLCEPGRCTAFRVIRDPQSIRQYDFVNVDCEMRLPMACRNEEITTLWELGRDFVFPNETGGELENRIATFCPNFHTFDIPKSPDDAITLHSAMSQYNIELAWVRYTFPVTCHRVPSLNAPADYYNVNGYNLQPFSALSPIAFVLPLIVSIYN